MLQIKHLTVTHTKDLRTIIKDFSFSLNSGDRAVIIGEEGNGKSTLLKLIYDQTLVQGYAEFEGEIVKSNQRLGYLAQELPDGQNGQLVSEFFAALPTFYDLNPRELAEFAAQLLVKPEFYYADQSVSSLSGGEKVKLQLAVILMARPDILLLDEPSNDLDLHALRWLEDFINGCGLPVLFVSHDETLIENTANVVIHLEQTMRKTRPICAIERTGYREYVERRLAQLSHQNQVARKEREEYDRQQEKFRRIQSKVEHQQNVISRGDPHGGQLLKKKMKAVKSMEHRFEREHDSMTEIPDPEEAIMVSFDAAAAVPSGKKVLDFTAQQLCVDGRVLSQNIKLNVIGPEKICITGRNGVGKTTLLRKIAQELLARTDIRAAYMPQNYEELLDYTKTPVDFLAASGFKEETTRVRLFLGSVKFTANEMEHAIAELSGGQKAKLLFLKMILGGANVLVLDEPTRNFSPLSNPVIRAVLTEYGGAIISVSHDRKYIAEVCDKVYELTDKGLFLM